MGIVNFFSFFFWPRLRWYANAIHSKYLVRSRVERGREGEEEKGDRKSGKGPGSTKVEELSRKTTMNEWE